MSEFFGFSIDRKDGKEKERIEKKSFLMKKKEAAEVRVMGNFGSGRDVTHYGMSPAIKNEFDLITTYRLMSRSQETSMAIDEICNDMVINEEGASSVEINLDNIDDNVIGKKTKKLVADEFEEILKLLNFNIRSYDIVYDWYVDSRIIFHKVIHNNPKDGIAELRQIPPKQIIRVVETRSENVNQNLVERLDDEYFVYYPWKVPGTENSPFGNGSSYHFGNIDSSMNMRPITASIDEIAYIPSGLYDEDTGITFGFLQSSMRIWNQLSLLEDSLVVHRLSRASDKKAYYVDTGNMSPKAAKKYVQEVKNAFRNDISYDIKTGTLANKKRILAMQEDYWLSRREGSRATEIISIDGSKNLSDIEDIMYMRDKFFNSLHVPKSRFKDSPSSIMLGHQSEIDRDELKYSKFISRLRKKFNFLFVDILRTQLSLKKIIPLELFDKISNEIIFKYLQDSYYAQAKELEILSFKLENYERIKPVVGIYYSHDFVRRNILGQSDDEIELIDKQIEEEKKIPRYSEMSNDGYG